MITCVLSQGLTLLGEGYVYRRELVEVDRLALHRAYTTVLRCGTTIN